jgi:hypothetical protein
MSRALTRHRTFLAGLAMTLGVAALGVSFNPAQAKRGGVGGGSFGENRVARAERLATELAAFTQAARTCDLDTTREAFEALESVWNAVEIDIQFNSPERYMFFEHVYLEDRVARGTGLEGDAVEPCDVMVALAEEQAATWDEAVDFLRRSPRESPLFNDVATLRTINQGIRLARTALDGYPEAVPQSAMTEPDPRAAKKHWLAFVADYPKARALIEFRNPQLADEIDGLVRDVKAAFKGAGRPDFPGASEALAALAARYNLAATLVTAAARGHIPVRPEFDPADPYTQGTIGDILTALEGMRENVELGTAEGAVAAQTLYLDHVQLSLSFKTGGPLTRADVALTNAVDAYVADQTPATAQALQDQIDVAEQIFVGQYWRSPRLVEFLQDL